MRQKKEKESTGNNPTERTVWYSSIRASLRRLWGCCRGVRGVRNNVLCRKRTRGKHRLLTDLTITEHHLLANGGNTIHNNKNHSRARCYDGRIRWKLVYMKNSSVVDFIGCVWRCQLNISLAEVLQKEKFIWIRLEQQFHQGGHTMQWVANPVRIITTFAVSTFPTLLKRSAAVR